MRQRRRVSIRYRMYCGQTLTIQHPVLYALWVILPTQYPVRYAGAVRLPGVHVAIMQGAPLFGGFFCFNRQFSLPD